MNDNINNVTHFHFPHGLIVVFLFSFPSSAFTQNLVPNADFEYFASCPYTCDVNGPMVCEPWYSYYSCNYFNVCNPGPCGVPTNFRGYQEPHGGNGYAGGYQKLSPGGVIERLQVELLEPLEAGQCYELSYWANLSDDSCPSNRLGGIVRVDDGLWPPGTIPQVDIVQEYFSDEFNWFEIYGTFIAGGGEQYLTIGNIYSNSMTQWDPACELDPFAYSYYYFDDVRVQAVETFPIDVDLGGPYIECTMFTLDPGIPNATYQWSDGSTGPTLTVTESGTYSVVVSFPGCIGGVAETEVTILGSDPVNLGPDLSFCAGESYTIILDPSAGGYVWDDGSTNNTYTITEPGIYSVTLDDGCDLTEDQILVQELAEPSFDLGPDQLLCTGQQILIQLDPNLGDFLWQDNSTASFFVVDEAGIYSLTITNDCGVGTDEIEISQLDPPDVDLGVTSLILCPGDTYFFEFDPPMGDYTWQDGSHDPFFNVNTAGTYSVFVSNECGVDSDSLIATEVVPPAVDLGPDALVCPGQMLTLEIGNATGDINWQDGSSGNEFEVTVSGAYSVTVTNDCGTTSDLILVDVEQPITPPDLGPDITICNFNPFVLEVDDTNASVLWSDGSTNNTFEVNSTDVYFVQVSSLCESYSDTVDIFVDNDPPFVTLPGDYSICDGQTTLLTPGITNVDFLWSDNSTGNQLLVSTPGLYAVTVTNDCGTDVDSIQIFSGGPPPAVSLGQDTSLCSGDTFILFPTYSQVNSWNWPDGSDTTFFLVNTNGMITVQASNACGVAFDTMMVSISPDVSPFYLGADTAICSGESVTLSIQVPDVSIAWIGGSTDDSLTVTNAGTYFATISNVCNSISDTIEISALPDVPVLDLGPDETFCPGETVTINPAIADVQYLWLDGSTGAQFQTSTAGLIALTISNSCGSSTDTIHLVESTSGPQVDLGPDRQACEGDTIIIDAGISGVSYLWQDGSSSNQFVATSSGLYHLTVQNACGMDQDTIQIVISGNAPQTALGPDTSLCIGSSMILNANAVVGTTNLWQNGSTADSLVVNTSGQYHLTQSNQCGVDRDTINIEFSGLPPHTVLPPDTSMCVGSTLLLSAVPSTNVTNLWQDGSSGNEFEVLVSGSYHLTQSNDCGTDADTIVVDISKTKPDVELGPDTLLCEGQTITLISGAMPGDIIEWQDGTTTPQFVVSQAGNYSLVLSNECGSNSDDIDVSYLAKPEPFDLGADTTICKGDVLNLLAPNTTDEWEWQDGSNSPVFPVTQAGVYALSIKNNCGTESDAIQISVEDHQPAFGEDVFVLCPGDEIQLNASQSFTASYAWSTGSVLPTIVISQTGVYAVTVTTLCEEATHQYEVDPDEDCNQAEIFIPNVFSPNHDQVNDVWTLQTNSGVQIESIDVTIYDRWGNVVFGSTDPAFIWDGTFAGKDVQSGVYVFKMNLVYELNGKMTEKLKSGDITVIR